MSKNKQQIHFIAIGGSLMHNLALALASQENQISGSDDEIYEPSRTKLANAGLLPESEGWYPEKITSDLDAVILGMHARKDNPELLKAQELGIPVYSFPEYIYQQSVNKQRIVITGSHGKSTITSMIMHVLKFHNRSFDFAVGAEVPGFTQMVKLSDAPVIIIEGDEYLSSALSPEPKFLKYHHHVVLISGIAWDHINVFPTEEEYIHQFEILADNTPKAGTVVYNSEDPKTLAIGSKERQDVVSLPYETPEYIVKDGITFLKTTTDAIPLLVFGKHNLQNMMGARQLLGRIGITDEVFYEAIKSFEGTAKRLEVMHDNGKGILFRDYAHAPSKVKATIAAVKEQYPSKNVIACLELHTFSSLTANFLPQYKNCFEKADQAVVYFNPHTIEHKKLPALSAETVRTAFGDPDINIFTAKEDLLTFLNAQASENSVVLMMSSGTFDNLNTTEIKALLD